MWRIDAAHHAAGEMDPPPPKRPRSAEHDSDPAITSKTPRYSTGRTRLACQSCRASKQRCDASERQPCRRCELYNVECIVEQAEVRPAPAARKATASPNNSESGAVRDQLQDITASLRRIEAALQTGRPISLNSLGVSPPGSSSSGQDHARQRRPSSVTDDAIDDGPVVQIERSTATVADEDGIEPPASVTDAIARGILTVDLARELFSLYFDKLYISFPACDLQLDTDAATVRTRNPLLYNTILLSAAYYVFLDSEYGRTTYAALATLQAELLGALFFVVRTGHPYMSRDTIKAILLTILRKPIQPTTDTSGVPVSLSRQLASKVNDTMSAMLLPVAIRIATLMGMRRRVLGILKAAERPSHADFALCRTWFGLCNVDAQGSAQGGRLPSLDPVDDGDAALLTRFYECRTQARDGPFIGFTALTRLGGAIRSGATEGPRSLDRHADEVARILAYEAELDQFDATWFPRLCIGASAEERTTGTLVAWNYRRFHCVAIISRWLQRWTEDYRNALGLPAHLVHRSFSNDQWRILESAVRAAEELLFALSVESRSEEAIEGRKVQWAIEGATTGGDGSPLLCYAALTPDPFQIESLKMAIDASTCVIIPYAALFLASQAGRTIDCNLCRRTNPSPSVTPSHEGEGALELAGESKLRRLFDLAAATLEQCAPNATHPAHAHATKLRQLVAAGLWANDLRSAAALPTTNGTTMGSYVNGGTVFGQGGGDIPVASSWSAATGGAGPGGTMMAVPTDYAALFGVDLDAWSLGLQGADSFWL